LLLSPVLSFALEIPQDGNALASVLNFGAQSYVVTDADTGEILISKNADMPWTPASLTKLVTALVVLDTKPNLNKVVTMTKDDQIVGQCSSGGACIKSKAGVKFTVDGLFHGLMLPSANNATNALARSTGLSTADFADRMNKKVISLGATNSHFNEPTGLDSANSITASDYAKIVAAAFSNSYLQKIAGLNKFYLRSFNNTAYNQTIKSTDKLLSDADVQVVGAKTGYLKESRYNFATLIKYHGGGKFVVVVLGEDHLYLAFAETKQLASLGEDAKYLAVLNQSGAVLGTSTTLSLNNQNN
jgi:D-alanyl-D-alanine carboxypeptidase (penicillin-binding protein 5/6)